METERRFDCTFRFLILLILVIFSNSSGYAQQQNVSVAVEFELTPLDVLTFETDGIDLGSSRSSNETCALGNVDSRGTPISGAPVGEPNVNGVAGIPVNSSGAPVASFDDGECVGAFYPFFAAAGGNTNNLHPNCAILIRMQSNASWMLTCQAQLVVSTPLVTVDQLKWKMDDISSNGFQNYTNFTTAGTTIASGSGSVNTRYYMDYGLLVEHADGPGANSWLVTYTLTAN